MTIGSFMATTPTLTMLGFRWYFPLCVLSPLLFELSDPSGLVLRSAASSSSSIFPRPPLICHLQGNEETYFMDLFGGGRTFRPGTPEVTALLRETKGKGCLLHYVPLLLPPSLLPFPPLSFLSLPPPSIPSSLPSSPLPSFLLLGGLRRTS